MYERAARRNTYVRYDSRGFGLSDRDVSDFSLDLMVRDLEAVADRLQLDRFRLIAATSGAPLAIAYAARYPKRLSHLVLWCGYARGADSEWPDRLNAMYELIETDWQFASEALILGMMGLSQDGPSHEYAALMREAVTPETFVLFTRQLIQWDVTHLLPSLTVPTLVAHRRQYPFVGVDAARSLAAAIPNAHLALLEGTSGIIGSDVNAAIGAFFREGEEPESTMELPEGMAVILLADIVESTALTEQLGDAAFDDRGEQSLKGVADPQRLFAVKGGE